MREIWKDVYGYDGDYQISSEGRVKSLKSGKVRILRQKALTGGYLYVWLSKNGKVCAHRVHRLVAKAFLQNEDGRPEVNHIDENKTNNSMDNLEWVTGYENLMHGTRNERVNRAKLKPVIQCDTLRGIEISRYGSAKEASEKTGLSASHISQCCLGKRSSHGGYGWRRAEVRA